MIIMILDYSLEGQYDYEVDDNDENDYDDSSHSAAAVSVNNDHDDDHDNDHDDDHDDHDNDDDRTPSIPRRPTDPRPDPTLLSATRGAAAPYLITIMVRMVGMRMVTSRGVSVQGLISPSPQQCGHFYPGLDWN